MKMFEFLVFGVGITLLASALSSCGSRLASQSRAPVVKEPVVTAVSPLNSTETRSKALMDLRIIIHEGRGDVTIAVKSGPDGRRYSVKDDERNVHYRDLTETELEEKYRGFLCSLIHYAVADAAERHVNEIEMTVSHQSLSPAQSDDSPVVVCLERRNHTITIKAGPNGAVYSITDKAGQILHRDLSEPELRAKAPALYQFIRTAIGSSGGLNANDASVRIGLEK